MKCAKLDARLQLSRGWSAQQEVAATRIVLAKKVGFSNWGTAGTITGEEMICGDQHCQLNDDDVEGIE